jgi:elongation factor P--beta-lysine ligase
MNAFRNVVTSYHTTIIGVSILLLEIVKCVQAGQVTADDVYAVLAGFGFIAAKDAGVTGANK